MIINLPVASPIFVFCRALGICTVLPFPDGLSSFSIRLSVSAAIALFLAPCLQSPPPLSVVTCVAEIAVGFLAILPFQVFMSLACSMGEIIDAVRGQTIGNMYDPSRSGPVSLMHELLRQYQWAVILASGAWESFIGLVRESYSLIPVGAVFAQPLNGAPLAFLQLSARGMTEACNLALPFVFACILVEAALGVSSRVGQGISLNHEVFAVKTVLVFMLLFLFFQGRLGEDFVVLSRAFLSFDNYLKALQG